MYELFTDEARAVMTLANQECQRLNHEYMGTEHILLGIVAHNGNGACRILSSAGIDLKNVEERIKERVSPGPDLVSMGKLPQAPRAKKVIEYAMEEARAMDLDYVGVEHLFLGLILEDGGLAGQVLNGLGFSIEKGRAGARQELGLVDENEVRRLLGELRQATRMPNDILAIQVAIPLVQGYKALVEVFELFTYWKGKTN